MLQRVVGQVLLALGEQHAVHLTAAAFAQQADVLVHLGQPAAQRRNGPLQRRVSAPSPAAIDVDTKGPTQKFVEAPPEYTNDPPAVIRGNAYDRNGVYDLLLIWDSGDPFPPDSVYMIGDTLFWRFDVLDSLVDGGSYLEGRHTLSSRCRDLFAGSSLHQTQISTAFTLDLTAPAAPVLEEPGSPARVPSVTIRGAVEWPGTKRVYLHRSAATDTTTHYDPAGATFVATVPLERGTNVIRATAEDASGNTSEPSNAVTVVYEPADVVDWPEALRGPDA